MAESDALARKKKGDDPITVTTPSPTKPTKPVSPTRTSSARARIPSADDNNDALAKKKADEDDAPRKIPTVGEKKTDAAKVLPEGVGKQLVVPEVKSSIAVESLNKTCITLLTI